MSRYRLRRWTDLDLDLLMAFPNIDHPPSNALCRAAGFTERGRLVEEFRGAQMELVAWGLDLGT